MNLFEEHVMIDIEALGSGPASSIMQIAAAKFIPKTGRVTSSFNTYIKGVDGKVDTDTLLWWLQQPSAKDIGYNIEKHGVPLFDALTNFSKWFSIPHENDPLKLPFWAHGTDYDISNLNSAFIFTGIKAPWRYSNARDCRTLYALKGKPTIERSGIHHNAYDDVMHQIKCVVEVLNRDNPSI